MLDYIYTNTVKIGSFENACELYSVANKYVLPEALFECSCYLLQSLNAKNICKAYEFSKLHNDPILKNKCIEMFPSLIKGIITDPSFMDIKLSTLREILSMDNLMISEIELFMGLRNYIIVNGYLTELSENNKKKIRFQNTQEGEIYQPDDITVQNSQRNIGDLKHAIRKIRFLLFTKEQFVEVVIKSGILSESEALAILLNIVLPLNKVCPMPDGFTTSKFRRYTHPLNYVDLDHVPWLIRRKLFN
ncbi:BTB/POZ domain-containing protein 3-like [Condylostylus longicornis]|uniref:BTB/POZ domain-containing protein 3-like n=1 Tax=Condylostylus longicornis TaxID=2530218 RepID=UPI00244E0677|nr:BTB/POZ domain-containing protein 3-like [Condylostylus longicornis]